MDRQQSTDAVTSGLTGGPARSPTTAWNEARRVLAVRLDSMGDVLMTTPALGALRSGSNVEHLALLTSPAGAAIAHMVPEVDEVIVYEAPWMKAGEERGVEYDLVLIERLRQARFDAAAVFTVYSQNPWGAAMLCRLAGIPLVLAHSRERAYRLVSDAVQETEPEQGIRHEVRRHLDLVATLGWTTGDERLSVVPPNVAVERVDALLDRLDLRGSWAVLHPGSTAPSRRYPWFGAVMRSLIHDHGFRILVTGDASERDLCGQLCAEAGGGENLSGQLDLGELVALIARAPLLVTNNTGPAHIAAATGTPVVDLYALTNPQHTPWLVPNRVLNHDVDCRWCYSSVCKTGHHLCLRGVPPEAVVAAASTLLGEGRSGTWDQVRGDGGRVSIHSPTRHPGLRAEVPLDHQAVMKALIFDMDGVVADTTPAHYRSWQRLADEEGVRFDHVRNEALLGRTREDSLAIFAEGMALDAATAIDWLARKQAYFLEDLANMGPQDLLPGVRDLLEEARVQRLATALASSSRNARAVIERLGVAPLFDVVADGDTVARPKPAPDVFLWVAEVLGLPPAACVVFEDSAAGVAAAVAGGFPVCALGIDAPGATWQRPDLMGARVDDFRR